MYRYDQFDHQFIAERVAHYRTQTQRYLAGELSETEFQHLRLRNGLYIQRLAPMLRVAVPYGTLSSSQLRTLAHIARYYDRGYGHLSTRQNMQFNWPELSEVPDILETLAGVEMHAIQTSGNCIRNVTTDQFAGVAADEMLDPRPYCEIIRQWSTSHPEFDWLPRKFKIAVTGARADRAAVDVHDIGLHVYRDDNGARLVDVKVGGGLGRTKEQMARSPGPALPSDGLFRCKGIFQMGAFRVGYSNLESLADDVDDPAFDFLPELVRVGPGSGQKLFPVIEKPISPEFGPMFPQCKYPVAPAACRGQRNVVKRRNTK